MSEVRLGAETSETADGAARGGRRSPRAPRRAWPAAATPEDGQVVHAHHVDRPSVARAGLEHQRAALGDAQRRDRDAQGQLGALQPQQLPPAVAAPLWPPQHLAPVLAQGGRDAQLLEHRIGRRDRAIDAPLVGLLHGGPRGARGVHHDAARPPARERGDDPLGQGRYLGGHRVGRSRWSVQSPPGPGRRRAHPRRPTTRSPRRARTIEAR